MAAKAVPWVPTEPADDMLPEAVSMRSLRKGNAFMR